LFLSDEDKPEVEASEYAWVLDLPEAEYIPPPPPPFPTDKLIIFVVNDPSD
jgi:hypothetical protein